MGIPSYFKKIIDDFPNVIHTKSKIKNNNFDNLFIDFNGCIHNCVPKVSNNSNDFENDLIKEVIKYMNEIFDFINPSKLFYISIDGIPPRSKMIQQRYRRYMGNWKKNKIIKKLTDNKIDDKIIEDYKNKWDTSAISPGTNFMNKLSLAIKINLKKLDKFQNIKTILSDSLEHGEGEFKIFKHIQNYISQNNSNKNDINVIHGLDADLIMLSLLQDANIYLLREPIFFKVDSSSNFIFLSISLFKDVLIQNYSNYFNDTTNLIKNYVFLCFLIGNDFIVNLMFLKFKNDSLEILLDIYKKISDKTQQQILIKNFTHKNNKDNRNSINSNNIENDIENDFENNYFNINYYFLSKFITELSKIEDEQMKIATNQLQNARPYIKINKEDSIIKKYEAQIELYPILNRTKDLVNAGIDKNWRAQYYYYIFDTTDGEEIIDICHNYLESLEFTLDYYFKQKYHPTWHYRYYYSPTILDLSNYLQSLDYHSIQNEHQIYNKDFKINIDNNNLYPDVDINIDLQLLMILPPSSKNLIKKKYHKLMEDIDMQVLHYYPEDFEISTYLKKWLWLCKPKLPDIDINLLLSKL